MNFKDPVSTFAYNLISLYHDIMWYIIIILVVVYWCLYKILKESIWTNFNKQDVNYFSGCHIFYLLKSRLDDLNKDYFRYIKGTVNRAEIKANELFFTKFIEPRIYADTFLRHAININTQYNEKKILYLNSKIYNKLLDRESELFMHPLIGRKLYKTDTELVLEFNVMTTKLYKIFYDQWSSKSVNVLKFNDKQGVVKSSIIIHIVKNIIENKDFFNGLNDKKYVYNIKWEEILNKLRNDPELIKQLGGDDIVDKMKFVYIKHAKEYGNLISFYADRVYISIDDFLVSGDNYNLKLQNAEE